MWLLTPLLTSEERRVEQVESYWQVESRRVDQVESSRWRAAESSGEQGWKIQISEAGGLSGEQ